MKGHGARALLTSHAARISGPRSLCSNKTTLRSSWRYREAAQHPATRMAYRAQGWRLSHPCPGSEKSCIPVGTFLINLWPGVLPRGRFCSNVPIGRLNRFVSRLGEDVVICFPYFPYHRRPVRRCPASFAPTAMNREYVPDVLARERAHERVDPLNGSTLFISRPGSDQYGDSVCSTIERSWQLVATEAPHWRQSTRSRRPGGWRPGSDRGTRCRTRCGRCLARLGAMSRS